MPYREIRFEGTPEEVGEQWRERRMHGIGGSDVAAIMGINKYKSPLSLYLEKTGQIAAPDLSGNNAVEWGNRLESAVREKFADEHPDKDARETGCMYVSVERPWAFANLDGIVTEPDGSKSVLECKTVGFRRMHDWDGGVPDYYLTQVTHYMSVTGFRKAYVAALIAGQEYREYEVGWDDEDVSAVERAVDSFWNDYVMAGVMPQLVGSPDESRALAAEFSEHGGDMVETDEYDADLDRLVELRAERDALNGSIRLLENRVKEAIGSHRGIAGADYRATWVRGKASRFDSRRFRRENPGEYEEYTVQSDRDGGLRIRETKGA